MPTASYWFFTLKAEGIDHSELKLNDVITFILFQRERGTGANNYEHFQGIFHTKQAVSMRAAKTAIGFPSIHLEQCRSDAAEAYVTKEETRISGPWTLGIRIKKKQGQRTDLAGVMAGLSGGKRLREIAVDFPTEFIKYSNGITKLEAIMRDKPRDGTVKPSVWVFWGPSGSGKTRRAWEMGTCYPKPSGNKWWDGYDGQEIVLFDDFSGHDSISPVELLSIVDRYPRIVEFKGGSRNLSSHKFIFTSNFEPSEWFRGTQWSWTWQAKSYDAFMRRVNEGDGEIVELTNE